jgi:hypothetical protein
MTKFVIKDAPAFTNAVYHLDSNHICNWLWLDSLQVDNSFQGKIRYLDNDTIKYDNNFKGYWVKPATPMHTMLMLLGYKLVRVEMI